MGSLSLSLALSIRRSPLGFSPELILRGWPGFLHYRRETSGSKVFRLKKNTCTFILTPVATLLSLLSFFRSLCLLFSVSLALSFFSSSCSHCSWFGAVSSSNVLRKVQDFLRALDVAVLHQKIAPAIVLPFLKRWANRPFLRRKKDIVNPKVECALCSRAIFPKRSTT